MYESFSISIITPQLLSMQLTGGHFVYNVSLVNDDEMNIFVEKTWFIFFNAFLRTEF